MRRAALCTALACVASLPVAAPAGAAPPAPVPTSDTVTGTVVLGVGLPTSGYTIDAFSGPNGEAPGGTIKVRGLLLNFDLPVTCLRVRGTRAVVAGPLDASGRIFTFVLVLEDVPAPAIDRGSVSIYVDTPAPACADVDIDQALDEVRGGSVTITDAPAPPTSKEECRDDAWRQRGFTSRGACQRLVPHPPGAPVASG
jgi:hypothetical protein